MSTTPAAYVLAAIQEISNKVNDLITKGNAFATSKALKEGVELHVLLRILADAILIANNTVKAIFPAPLSASDSRTVLARLQSFEPVILQGIQIFKTVKVILQTIVPFPVSAIITAIPLARDDIVALSNNAMSLLDALVAVLDDSVKPDAQALRDRLATAIGDLLTFYTS